MKYLHEKNNTPAMEQITEDLIATVRGIDRSIKNDAAGLHGFVKSSLSEEEQSEGRPDNARPDMETAISGLSVLDLGTDDVASGKDRGDYELDPTTGQPLLFEKPQRGESHQTSNLSKPAGLPRSKSPNYTPDISYIRGFNDGMNQAMHIINAICMKQKDVPIFFRRIGDNFRLVEKDEDSDDQDDLEEEEDEESMDDGPDPEDIADPRNAASFQEDEQARNEFDKEAKKHADGLAKALKTLQQVQETLDDDKAPMDIETQVEKIEQMRAQPSKQPTPVHSTPDKPIQPITRESLISIGEFAEILGNGIQITIRGNNKFLTAEDFSSDLTPYQDKKLTLMQWCELSD